VDAAVVWQPWLYQLEKEKKGTVLFNSANIPGLIPDLLVFKADVAQSRAAEIQKIVNTWFEVVAYIKENQADAVKIMAKVVEQKPEDYAVFLPGTKFFDLKANLEAFQKSSDHKSLVGSGTTIGDFLKGLDQIKKVPDYEAALESKFVKAVK
jgi:NitT/TauT family transport system substrate-binding protein